jgi:putative tricarboxylic transport membrane protein
MQNHSNAGDDDKSVISTGAMEIVVSVLFMLVSALVIYDSLRLGHGWGDYGPDAGYFPFYVALIMGLAAAGNLLLVVFGKQTRAGNSKPFVTWGRFKPVLLVFIPVVIYIVAMYYVGLYVASAIFIGMFMRINGKYGLGRILPVAISVPVIVYLMFELWFLVPLPKGPLESLLGL